MRGKSFKLHQSIFDGNTDHQPRQVLFFISDPWAPETEFQLAGSHFTPRCENTSWSLTDCSLLLLCLLAAPDQRRVLLLPPSSSLWVTSNSGTHRTAVTTLKPHFLPCRVNCSCEETPRMKQMMSRGAKTLFPPFFLHTRWQTQTGHYSFIYSKHAIMCQLACAQHWHMSEPGNRQEMRLQIHHTLDTTCFGFPQAIALMNSYVRWSLLVHKILLELHR